MSKLPDELKEAILQMSEQKRNKLLLKLIGKNDKLIKKLTFKLLEKGTTKSQRVEAIVQEVHANISTKKAEGLLDYMTFGGMMMEISYSMGPVNEYAEITRDKAGELRLIAFILDTYIEFFTPRLQQLLNPEHAVVYTSYVIQKIRYVQQNIGKIDEATAAEVKGYLQATVKHMYQHLPSAMALADAGIPEILP